jgi:hypothetical protein
VRIADPLIIHWVNMILDNQGAKFWGMAAFCAARWTNSIKFPFSRLFPVDNPPAPAAPSAAP